MRLQENISFLAKGYANKNSISVPVTFSGEFSNYSIYPVRCKVVPSMEILRNVPREFSDSNVLELEGKAENGDEIWIPHFELHSSQSNTRNEPTVCWEGIAKFFVQGDLSSADEIDGKIHISLYTNSTQVALSNTSHRYFPDGTSEILIANNREPLKWITEIGEAEYIDVYVHNDFDDIRGDKTQLRIRRCRISLQTHLANSGSLKSVIVNLSNYLIDALWLISFLSRKYVDWYDGLIYYENESQGPRRIKLRRDTYLKGRQNDDSSILDLLVEQKALKEGLFNVLYKNYISSQYHDTFRLAITHLLSSYESNILEIQYSSAITSLESLVDGIGDPKLQYLLGSSQTKKLRKEIKKIIGNIVDDEETANEILEKTGELRRRSFRSRLLILTKDLNLSDLWPSDRNPREEFKNLIQRRDIYVHQGKMDNSATYYFDLVRIRYLIEIWILKLLGCPKEKLNEAALHHVEVVNNLEKGR